MRRGDAIPLQSVSDEIADVAIYLDLLAARLGINLEEAVVKKFNEVSEKIGSTYTLS
jgi:NTP pyrophosphatase (non-canonical NTP hydrolase)